MRRERRGLRVWRFGQLTSDQAAALIQSVADIATKLDAIGTLLAILHQVGLAVCGLLAVLVFFEVWRYKGGLG